MFKAKHIASVENTVEYKDVGWKWKGMWRPPVQLRKQKNNLVSTLSENNKDESTEVPNARLQAETSSKYFSINSLAIN